MIRGERIGPRLTLVIDDPDRRNPLTTDAMAELLQGVRAAASDPDIRAIVITGAGERVFSAGGDLSGGFVEDPLVSHTARGALADLFREMRRCPQPVLARVNGHALAGGFGLAAACDIVVAVEDATFGMPEITVGLWPMMITAVLHRVMPHKAALELMISGRRIGAVEARDLGVVSRIVARDDLDTTIDELVASIAASPGGQVAMGKRAFYAVEDLDFDTALDYLQSGLTAAAMTRDAAEGVSAFLDKRAPEWSGG